MSVLNKNYQDIVGIPPLSTQKSSKIWAVGGGKGGVGKSLMTANLSICLALMGHKVVAIDLDLGGANLHTCLGVPIPDKTLSDYLDRKVLSLSQLQTPTLIENLSIISGAKDSLGVANMKQAQKTKILSTLEKFNADFILLDLGAGTAVNTLDFFIAADKGILTVLPEPTSIENTYRFIRSVYHRKSRHLESLLEIGPLVEKVMNSQNEKNTTPVDFVQNLIKANPKAGHHFKREMEGFRPELIVNQTRTQTDIDIGYSMSAICQKYFGIKLGYAGYVEYDSIVWQSVKRRKPLLIEFPNSELVNNFDNIIHRLLDIA